MKTNPRDIRLTVGKNLPKKTDVTLAEWAKLVSMCGPHGSKKQQAEWLRDNYGLGKVQASVIVDFAIEHVVRP
jgi:hypothetical protein